MKNYKFWKLFSWLFLGFYTLFVYSFLSATQLPYFARGIYNLIPLLMLATNAILILVSFAYAYKINISFTRFIRIFFIFMVSAQTSVVLVKILINIIENKYSVYSFLLDLPFYILSGLSIVVLALFTQRVTNGKGEGVVRIDTFVNYFIAGISAMIVIFALFFGVTTKDYTFLYSPDFLISIIILIFLSIPILDRLLPSPTKELRKKNPFLFVLDFIIGILAIIIFISTFSSAIGDFFKMIIAFINGGCFICN